jgi:uncharacterized protein
MTDVTAEQLELLLELQGTDSRLRRIEHQLDDLPEQQQLDASVERVAELGREHDDVRVELDRAAAGQRQLEREIDVLTQRRDAERTRLYGGAVANARELKAVEAEIETTVRRIDEHEELLLEVMETVDELQRRADGLAATQAAERELVETRTEDRDRAAKELIAEQAELAAVREAEAEQLPSELLSRYEQAAARAGGTGVGKLVGNACTACRIELSMADVGQLYAGPPLTTCPQCRRLLVVPA